MDDQKIKFAKIHLFRSTKQHSDRRLAVVVAAAPYVLFKKFKKSKILRRCCDSFYSTNCKKIVTMRGTAMEKVLPKLRQVTVLPKLR